MARIYICIYLTVLLAATMAVSSIRPAVYHPEQQVEVVYHGKRASYTMPAESIYSTNQGMLLAFVFLGWMFLIQASPAIVLFWRRR